jgi:hypothetical protein
MMLRKLPLTLAAAASLLLFLPVTAQAATGSSGVTARTASVPGLSPGPGLRLSANPKRSVCQRVTAIPGVTKRCPRSSKSR